MTVETAATVREIAKQIGSELLPDNDQWTNRFQIESHSSNSKYVIAQQRASGTWGCSCPGWRHYRKCKHLTDVLQRLASLAERIPAYSRLNLMASARTAYLDLDPVRRKVQVVAPKGRVVDMD